MNEFLSHSLFSSFFSSFPNIFVIGYADEIIYFNIILPFGGEKSSRISGHQPRNPIGTPCQEAYIQYTASKFSSVWKDIDGGRERETKKTVTNNENVVRKRKQINGEIN